MQVEVEQDGGAWWSTSELRFKSVWIGKKAGSRLVLQQRWFGSGGREEWRDVPIIDGDAIPNG